MGKKTAVVYFSLTGHTQAVAEIVQEVLDADIIALKPIKSLNSKSSMKFVWGGYQAKMNKTPDLEPYEFDVEKYGFIILGSPVWAWTLSPPMRSFLKQHDLTNKKVAFWMGSMGPKKKAAERFKKALPECNLVGELHLQGTHEENWGENYRKAKEWAQTLQ
ncbi:flavodoxin family protein [Candidatus Lokiarchaeum ossiferum]